MASVNSKIHSLEDNYNTVSKKLKHLEAQIRTLLVEQNNIKCDADVGQGKHPNDSNLFLYINNNFNNLKVIVAFIFYFNSDNNIG